ncbi:MAG TPA: DUF6537 domain-containing protein, partial [Bryobacteraceae bacterium]|nr:DUF6537 domain-containing protein [Bryobacteraceae bacterium]
NFLKLVESRAPALKETVARSLFKLMAYKDEYEVARLLTQSSFEQKLRQMWEAPESISYNLHPPLLRRFGFHKMHLGPWFRIPLRLLARMKSLRGTPLDIFGYSPHRRRERQLIDWYRGLIEDVLDHAAANPALALEIAALPDQIRGYESIKERSIETTKRAAAEKLALLRQAATQPVRTL